MKVRIGIDPGADGFFTIWDGEEFTFIPMPKIGKELDLLEISKIFDGTESQNMDIYCVLEDVHALFKVSAKSTWQLSRATTAIEMMLVCRNIPFTRVAPKKWQRQMFEGIPLQQKPSSTGKTMVTDTKKMSIMAAKRMFPTIDLRRTPKCDNPHDGKTDSLLICEYCKRNF